MPKLRISITKALVIVALVAILLRFLIVPVGRQMEWLRLHEQMDTSIRYLSPTHPKLNEAATWECAHDWVITAYGNICFSPEHVNTSEMYRLRDDLDEKLRGTIDLDTLKWIWRRLGQTGPHGERYARRHEPALRDCFPPGTW